MPKKIKITSNNSVSNKTADLVYKTFSTIKCNLMNTKISHTDNTKEKNYAEVLLKALLSIVLFSFLRHSIVDQSRE